MSQVIDRPDLASSDVYATGLTAYGAGRAVCALRDAFAQHPWPHWQSRMRAASVPCGKVRTVGEAIRSPEARERGIVTRIPHETLGWVPNVNLPIRYSHTPVVDPVAAPGVGEHTQQVLRELLGYGDARLPELPGAGAFGTDELDKSSQAVKSSTEPPRNERTLRGRVAVVGVGETKHL